MDKTTARTRGLKQRASLSKETKLAYDEFLLARMKELSKDKQCIGIFVSYKSEPDTLRFIEYALKNHKTIAVPKVTGDTLVFYAINSLSDLKEGAYHILEPITSTAINVETMDILFVPLSSYDPLHNRTGYGKGYYDHILPNAKLTVGLAYTEQEVDFIETDPWDIPLDEILVAR